MKYDSKQLEMELIALRHNRDVTSQNFHKICGAIEMVEAMHKQALENEQAEQAKLEEAEKREAEPVPESAAA